MKNLFKSKYRLVIECVTTERRYWREFNIFNKCGWSLSEADGHTTDFEELLKMSRRELIAKTNLCNRWIEAYRNIMTNESRIKKCEESE